MRHEFSSELAVLVSRHMASGRYSTVDELLQTALEALAAEDDDLHAVQAALDALDRGDTGISLDEAFAALRVKYQLDDEKH